MAKAKLSPGLEELTGKLNSQTEVTTRIKNFRAPDGHVIKFGPQEYYYLRKRDYRLAPLTPAEQAQRAKWSQACRLSSAIRHDPAHPRYAELRQRWLLQLDGQPDPAFAEHGRKPRKYTRFDTFLNALLLLEL